MISKLPATVHDGVQTMGNSQHGALFEFLANCSLTMKRLIISVIQMNRMIRLEKRRVSPTELYLNQVVSFQVDGGGGFVEHQHLGLSQERARQANQLPLADA